MKTGHKIMTHKFTKNISCMRYSCKGTTLSRAISVITMYRLGLNHSYKHNLDF